MPAEEQGISLDRYMSIPRSLIFLFEDEKVLLLKGAPDKRIWANKFNGIGGHVEPGENLLEATHRELLEETGLKDESLFLSGIVTIDTGQNPGITLYVWKGTNPEGQLVESREGILEWVPLDKLDDFPLVEDLFTILPLIYQKQPQESPMLAHYHYEDDQLVVEVINS